MLQYNPTSFSEYAILYNIILCNILYMQYIILCIIILCNIIQSSAKDRMSWLLLLSVYQMAWSAFLFSISILSFRSTTTGSADHGPWRRNLEFCLPSHFSELIKNSIGKLSLTMDTAENDSTSHYTAEAIPDIGWVIVEIRDKNSSLMWC